MPFCNQILDAEYSILGYMEAGITRLDSRFALVGHWERPISQSGVQQRITGKARFSWPEVAEVLRENRESPAKLGQRTGYRRTLCRRAQEGNTQAVLQLLPGQLVTVVFSNFK